MLLLSDLKFQSHANKRQSFFRCIINDFFADQLRLYREFVVMVYPAIYMSPAVFTQFMLDLGWQKAQCPSLFRLLPHIDSM